MYLPQTDFLKQAVDKRERENAEEESNSWLIDPPKTEKPLRGSSVFPASPDEFVVVVCPEAD